MSKKDLGIRPICINVDCGKDAQFMGTYNIVGTPAFRKTCGNCNRKNIIDKRGVTSILEVTAANAGFDSVEEYQKDISTKAGFDSYADYNAHKNHQIAIDAGFDSYADYNAHKNHQIAIDAGFENYTDYTNSKHPYRKYRLTYCENVDSRLDYRCTTTIKLSAQLEVDHIDGDPSNNDPENLQTLCSCCHKYKTIMYEDHKSPGRKALGVK